MRRDGGLTLDAPRRSCFFPYMLFRMLKTSVRRLRPSAGASPATLLAVVLGFVSESCLLVSLRCATGGALDALFVPCSRVCPDSTVDTNVS